MAYRYSDIGYSGSSCIEEIPDFCVICGRVCKNDPDYCDDHLAMHEATQHALLQESINVQLDDLGEFVTNL